jgi:hypothetical protein
MLLIIPFLNEVYKIVPFFLFLRESQSLHGGYSFFVFGI